MAGEELMAAIARARTAKDALEKELSAVERHAASLASLVDYHDTNKGKRFERWFRDEAESRGLSVVPATDSKHDVLVNGKRVQCKRIDKESGCICTTPIIGRPYCGYERDDWDVLAIQQRGTLLLIPVEAMLMDDGNRVMNVIRIEDWISWKDRWGVFGERFSFRRESQVSLFGAEG